MKSESSKLMKLESGNLGMRPNQNPIRKERSIDSRTNHRGEIAGFHFPPAQTMLSTPTITATNSGYGRGKDCRRDRLHHHRLTL